MQLFVYWRYVRHLRLPVYHLEDLCEDASVAARHGRLHDEDGSLETYSGANRR